MRSTTRWLAVTVLLGAAAACGSEPGPEPAPEPLVYVVDGFRIEDVTREASQARIDSIAAALGAAVTAVSGLLPEFTPIADTITFRLQAGGGIPFVTPAELFITQWERDLALEYLPHQVTHLLTGYLQRPFVEEGLAVYVTGALDPTSTITNPYRGQPPDAWVSLFEGNGSTIPLGTALGATNLGYAYTGSTADASAWQLFIEAGSFTRWVITNFGQDAWLEWYGSDDLEGTLGASVSDLEQSWLAATRAAHPAPLPCEAALETRGPLTTREEFWCARARGE